LKFGGIGIGFPPRRRVAGGMRGGGFWVLAGHIKNRIKLKILL